MGGVVWPESRSPGRAPGSNPAQRAGRPLAPVGRDVVRRQAGRTKRKHDADVFIRWSVLHPLQSVCRELVFSLKDGPFPTSLLYKTRHGLYFWSEGTTDTINCNLPHYNNILQPFKGLSIQTAATRGLVYSTALPVPADLISFIFVFSIQMYIW